MIIVLMGYMGSGKSTIGSRLATIFGYSFIDLDDFIVSKEGVSITKIFNTKGEIYFRKKEAQYLNEILKESTSTILSLGGGTPCYGNNLDLVSNNKNIKSFYLKTSIPELLKRLKPEKNTRPIVSHLESDEELMEFFGKHLFERSPFYSKSDYTIVTDNKPVAAIVEEIVMKLI